jgi:aldehyde:ferredoxin oxidoreductase
VDSSGAVLRKVPRSEWAKPVIDSEICTACSMCVDICSAGALGVTLPKYKGDIECSAVLTEPKKCVSCGLCERICPLAAISIPNVNDAANGDSDDDSDNSNGSQGKGRSDNVNGQRGKGRSDDLAAYADDAGRVSAGLPLPRYALIDLSSGDVSDYPVKASYYEKFVGGKALAAKLLLDIMPRGTGVFDADSVIIVNTGPLNGTGAPSSNRFNASFKSVLSGGIASSNCGGPFGSMLRRAGYEGLIIKGKAQTPVLIDVTDGVISLQNADALWGLDSEKTQEELPKHYAKFVIGPAGENLVKYASIVSGERVAGRCGGGAVFGSKNLKGIICYGTKPVPIYNRAKFKKFLKKWVRFTTSHPMTGEALPRYGSAGLLNKANSTFALPTHNFKYGHYKDADKVSGETLTETLLTRNSSCLGCPIRCERRVMVNADETAGVNRSDEDTSSLRAERSNPPLTKEVKGPEYETLGLFGSDMDDSDLQAIIDLNYKCDILGMDTISCASTIAFAMELHERGIADLGVRFGHVKDLVLIVEKIARREGIYAELADGSKVLSEKYGGSEYAIQSKGLELAAYEPRRSVGMGLGYATSNRGGCHLNGGYMAIMESVGVLAIEPQSPGGKVEMTIFFQDALEAVSTVGSCLFSAQTFVPAILYKLGPNNIVTRIASKVLKHAGPLFRVLTRITPVLRFNSFYLLPHAEAVRLATGLTMYTGQFVDLGERSFNLERLYSIREGLTAADDSLPKRLTDEPQDKSKKDTVVPLSAMIPKYYKFRGWDGDGVPKPVRLKQLKIES